MKDLLPLLHYLKKYKVKLVFGFFLIVLTISLQATYPLVVGTAIDNISKKESTNSIIYYSLLSVSIIFLSGIFLFFTRRTIIVASREIENDLRYNFFSHLQYLPISFFDKTSTGDIMAHATNDINNVRNLLGPGIMYSIQTFLRTIITLTILFTINFEIALIALIPLPLISYIVYRVMKYTYTRSMKVQEAFSKLTTKVQENFSGIRVIKSYVREDYEIEQFNRISNDYQSKNLSLARMQAFSFPMMFLLTGLSIILVLYFGGLKVIDGKFTIGNIAEFIVYLGQLTWPMIALGWVISLVQRAAPSMKRLTIIMNQEKELNNNVNSSFNNNINGNIEFKNVFFKYETSTDFILRDINLNIPEGTSLGIVGYTGEGKTTLVNLIARIYDTTKGEILIDGNNINKIPLKILRDSIGFVPQESFLFSDTIENNIKYSGKITNETNNKVKEISILAGLYKDIELFPEGFKTLLGERGITLSGGQKQRTSIARAIYKNPKILILDDSFSAVDTHTEDEILNNLKDIMKGRTCILISHRISTIKNCNNIIVLDKGKIVEQGSHNQLLELKGIYYSLFEKQLLEDSIEEI